MVATLLTCRAPEMWPQSVMGVNSYLYSLKEYEIIQEVGKISQSGKCVDGAQVCL